MLQRLLHPMSLFIALLLIVLGLLAVSVSGTAASATEEPCVPKDAWTEVVVVTPAIPATPGTPAVPEVTADVFDHWQRYSWTGGPHAEDSPPPFPSDDWQPNVEGDPHGVGVEGAYFRSNGNSGRGDWFYLEAVTVTIVITPGIPAVPGTPEVPAVTKEVHHPAIVCPPPSTPPTPTETPTVPTETPTVTETPSVTTSTPVTPVVTETPVVPTETPTATTSVPTPETPDEEEGEPEKDKPGKDKPGDSSTIKQSTRCEDGVWLTEVFTDGALTSTSSAGTCGEDTRRVFSIGETG